MREDTVTTTVYEFDELSDEAKAAAILELSNININYDWWGSTYDDAATIGLKITSSDEHNVEGHFVDDAESTAQLILEEHGEDCETHKDAWEFQNAVGVQGSIYEAQDDFDAETDAFTDSDEYEELCSEFLETLCEDYRIMLGKEYDYLCGDEAIIESIKTNKYEFTEAGELYN